MLVLSLTIAGFSSCANEDVPSFDELTIESSSESFSTEASKETQKETSKETQKETSAETNIESDEETTKNSDEIEYLFHKVNDQYYLSYNYDTNDEFNQLSPPYVRVSVPFDSFEELIKNLTIPNLEEWHEIAEWCFRRDENGFKILDPDNLYYPYYLHNSCALNTVYSFDNPTPVYWSGDYYTLSFSYNGITRGGTVSVFTKDAYLNYIEEHPLNMDIDPLNPTESSYVITRGNKKATVIYKLEDGVYSNIRFYMEEGDMYSLWSFFELTELPSEDFVFSFGLDKYVPSADTPAESNDVAVKN